MVPSQNKAATNYDSLRLVYKQIMNAIYTYDASIDLRANSNVVNALKWKTINNNIIIIRDNNNELIIIIIPIIPRKILKHSDDAYTIPSLLSLSTHKSGLVEPPLQFSTAKIENLTWNVEIPIVQFSSERIGIDINELSNITINSLSYTSDENFVNDYIADIHVFQDGEMPNNRDAYNVYHLDDVIIPSNGERNPAIRPTPYGEHLSEPYPSLCAVNASIPEMTNTIYTSSHFLVSYPPATIKSCHEDSLYDTIMSYTDVSKMLEITKAKIWGVICHLIPYRSGEVDPNYQAVPLDDLNKRDDTYIPKVENNKISFTDCILILMMLMIISTNVRPSIVDRGVLRCAKFCDDTCLQSQILLSYHLLSSILLST